MRETALGLQSLVSSVRWVLYLLPSTVAVVSSSEAESCSSSSSESESESESGSEASDSEVESAKEEKPVKAASRRLVCLVYELLEYSTL